MWEEYRSTHPQGYRYSWFCDLYRAWHGKIDLVMRQDHQAGEKLFVDYAGQTVPIVDRRTGEILFDAEIFVAVMGASNYSYAEATRTQTLPDWIGAHVRAFAFFGGVPEIVVPDNRGGPHPSDRGLTGLRCRSGVGFMPPRCSCPAVQEVRADRSMLHRG